jgi:hypothetical protein
MVYYYRLIRPHIIITKHNPQTASAQHLAVVALGVEAFDLAGNPAVYPEQLREGLFPWQPLRLYQRTMETPYDVIIDAGETALPENKTFHELALQALSQYASQGGIEGLMGTGSQDLPRDIYYRLASSNRVFTEPPAVPGESAEKVLSDLTRGPDRPMPGQDIVIEKDTYFTENKDISPRGLFVVSGTVRVKSGVTLTVGKDRGVRAESEGKIELEKDARIQLK